MRILIENAHRNLVGGVEKYLQAVIPGLLDRGHELGMLYEYRCEGGRECIDPAAGSLRFWCLAESDPETVLSSIADWAPDVVYSQGLDGSVDVENAILNEYPAVLYIHNYDRTCATGRKCYSFPQIRACTRKLGTTCLLLHYPRRCGGLHPATMWREFRKHTQLNSQLADHRAILVASQHMYREMQSHGIQADRLRLVPLPTTDVAPGEVPPASRTFTGDILFVGRLTDIKGASYLIQAVPSASAALGRALKLTIAGDGPERQSLQDLANRLRVPVEFAGWIQTRQKLELMHQADLVAVPSLWPEPFGLVGIEAGCLGLPAVGYATGGILDWLIPGQSGELAPADPPTVEGLSAAIVRALSTREHYASLSRGAWEIAKQFTLPKHMAQLEQILGIDAARPRAQTPQAAAPAAARVH